MQVATQKQEAKHKGLIEFYRFREVDELFSSGLVDEAKQLLSELQNEYIMLCDENNLLKHQVKEFEHVLDLSKNFVCDGALCWLISEEIKQGPFCKDCFIEDSLLVRLLETDKAWQCPSCCWSLKKSNANAQPKLNSSDCSLNVDCNGDKAV